MQQLIGISKGTDDLASMARKVNEMMTEIYTGKGPVPAWVRVGYALGFGLFATPALTSSITMFQLVPNQIIHAVKIKHSEPFSGGGLTGYTVSVGVGGTADKYASAFDVFQAPGSRIYEVSLNLDGEDAANSTPVIATATSTGANLDAATMGTVDIWALLSVAAK